MPNPNSPWRQDPEPKHSTGGGRLLLWLALIAVVVLLAWKLPELFPGSVSSDYDRANVVRLVGLLALVSAGVLTARQFKLRETLRNIAIWAAIVAVLVLGFTFQDDLRDIGMRVRSELIPGEPVTAGANEMVLSESADGQFHVIGEANGTRVEFLIDTGASDIVLSPDDAKRIGIDVSALDFSRNYETANGVGHGAPTRLETLAIGNIAFDNVPVSVNQPEMRFSLLGVAFLKRLSSYEVRGRRLFLRWR
jgi:aspartyl protease family protein